MEISGKVIGGQITEGPYRQVGQIRLHLMSTVVPQKEWGASMILPVRQGNGPWGSMGTNSSGKWLQAGREMMAFVLPLKEGGDQARIGAVKTGGGVEK